jgi:hypothetical protein
VGGKAPWACGACGAEGKSSAAFVGFSQVRGGGKEQPRAEFQNETANKTVLPWFRAKMLERRAQNPVMRL